MSEAVVIIGGLVAVVALAAYKYCTLGEPGAEFDLVIKRGNSIADPRDPHRTIELNLGSDASAQGGDPSDSKLCS